MENYNLIVNDLIITLIVLGVSMAFNLFCLITIFKK